MNNPFLVSRPCLLSFSGGRTSARMLKGVLDAYGGKLPEDVYVCFANTGKEREETLVFVEECSQKWGVKINWLEYKRSLDRKTPSIDRFYNVNFQLASRNGEPFARLIEKKKFLPNVVTRYCTTWLKIQTMKHFMLSQGHKDWFNAVGLRFDELHRVANVRKNDDKERWVSIFPLADARVTRRDVDAFWANSNQGFDLGIKSYQGNCDMCFLKGIGKLRVIAQENPSSCDWWIKQEEKKLSSKPSGARFVKKGPSYADIKWMAENQTSLLNKEDLEKLIEENTGTGVDCFCTD